MHIYSWNEWITFFFLYSFMGWLWESAYVSVRERKPVNRGFLRLPLLPLYGFGALSILALSLPFRGNAAAQFFAGMFAATILEYFTGWAMEKLFRMRYWDYSRMKLNLNGYICAAASLLWGVFTLLLIYGIHPFIERLVLDALNPLADYILVGGLSVLFAVDTVLSAKAALDMGKALEKLTEIRAQLDEVQVQIALLKAETVQYIEDEYAKKVRQAAGLRAEKKEETAARMTMLAEKLMQLNERKEKITKGMSFVHRGLLLGNPTAVSAKFGAALKELKGRLH